MNTKRVLNPIRHAETQNATIEFGVFPGLGDDESQMPELEWPNSSNIACGLQIGVLRREHLSYGALGILE